MCQFLPFNLFEGKKNMEIDSKILEYSINNNLGPTLRLYGWNKPTVTIGRNQLHDSVNIEFCNNNKIDVIRRITGGKAVFHSNEITYSFVCPITFLDNGNTIKSSYKEISEALIIAFEKINIKLAFPEYKKVVVDKGYCMSISTGSDLSYEGKKIIGSAQFRSQNYILQHGSILIDIDNNYLQNLFGESYDRNSIITLKEINSHLNYFVSLPELLKQGFEEKFNMKFNYLRNFSENIGL